LGAEIRHVANENDVAAVRSLWSEYWASAGLSKDFQGFAEEVKNLPGLYAPPRGSLILARVGAFEVGSIGLRPLTQNTCEAKHLYVRPKFRGQGIGRSLLEHLIEAARSMRYEAMYGDSLPGMVSAQNLYKNIGFEEVGPYSVNPTPEAIYLRLKIS
jgi:ribosomal protein S18 acetylase RimI-like enzyme